MARALVLGVLVVAIVACAGRREATTQPNILLVSLDALRADHLSCYGYDRPTSPVLDRLAAGKGRWVKPTAEQVQAVEINPSIVEAMTGGNCQWRIRNAPAAH